MPEELYKVLGVKPDATQGDIRNAYRSLAKKHHPDLNPGDKSAEDTFKKVQAAYDLLSDEAKRRQYDAGEIDAEGKETARRFYREYAGADSGHPYQSSAGFKDFGDIFSDLFRGRHQGQDHDFQVNMRGGDAHYRLTVSFLEAINGATKRLTLPSGETLDVAVPAGHRDGQMLRLKGKGMPGLGDGKAGDAYIEIQVAAHEFFRRRGRDILIDLPVGIHEAVLGAKISVPTPAGKVTMTVPPGSNTGDVLRLKGKGVPAVGKHAAGDQLVTLSVALPEKADPELTAFLEKWSKDHAYNPRRHMGG